MLLVAVVDDDDVVEHGGLRLRVDQRVHGRRVRIHVVVVAAVDVVVGCCC